MKPFCGRRGGAALFWIGLIFGFIAAADGLMLITRVISGRVPTVDVPTHGSGVFWTIWQYRAAALIAVILAILGGCVNE